MPVRKSRRLAVRHAELSKRKKLRRKPLLLKREGEGPTTSTPPPNPAEKASPPEASSPSSEATTPTSLPQTSRQEVVTTPSSPWRYAYVLADLRKIGLISGGIFMLLGILTIFLR